MDATVVSGDTRVVARTALVLFVALVLQLGLVDDLRIFSVHAELLLAVAAGTAVAWGPERGAIVGFAAGLMTDLFLPGRFGTTALAWGLACYATGMLGEGIVRRSRLADAGLVALGSAVGTLLYAVVGTLLGAHSLSDPNLVRIIAIVAATGAVLSPVVVPVCRWAGHDGGRLRPSR